MQVYPNEGCGILLGRDNGIEKIKPSENLVNDEKGRTFFMIDPLTVYREECEAEKEGLEVIGFYHSHPDKKAIPSKTDEEYMIPEMLYIIVSVYSGEIADIKGYIKDYQESDIKEINVR